MLAYACRARAKSNYEPLGQICIHILLAHSHAHNFHPFVRPSSEEHFHIFKDYSQYACAHLMAIPQTLNITSALYD